MSKDLAVELGTQETPYLEFKSTARDRDAIRKAICAMANDLGGSGGGDVLIGVDKVGSPTGGIDTSDDELLKLSQIRDEGKILEFPSMRVESASYQGTPVIWIHVNASHTPPVRLDGVAWVRPGPLTKRATATDERILTERRTVMHQPFDSRPVPGAATSDLDIALFETTYLPSAVDPAVLEENHRPLQQQLSSLAITDPDGVPTGLGLLLLGLDPSKFIPGAYLQFVRYAGVDFDAPIANEQEIRGNIISSAKTLESLIRGSIRAQVVAGEGFREETRPDYPYDALREICMNAVMHRAYEGTNAPIRILWFDDRLEVSNPGGPYGQVRADNYDRRNDYRNPALASAMKTLGYVNRFGRGIRRVIISLDKNGNPPAEFDIDDVSWTVTLRGAP